MLSLAEFQTSFANNLLSTELATMPERDTAAMTVYRNTTMKGLIDALAANYPTVFKLVGNEWFEAAAIRFIHDFPAATPVLAEYGKGFAEFLTRFAPANELPYLSDVAKLDGLWIESYFASDASTLQPSVLQALGEQLFNARLSLHPATRLCAVSHSAASIWLHNHTEDASTELQVDNENECALITRREHTVELVAFSALEHTFIISIAAGSTLGEAATTVLETDSQFPLAETLAKFIKAGCFADNQFRSW